MHFGLAEVKHDPPYVGGTSFGHSTQGSPLQALGPSPQSGPGRGGLLKGGASSLCRLLSCMGTEGTLDSVFLLVPLHKLVRQVLNLGSLQTS